MFGGSGNDVYEVDDIGDVVTEDTLPGTDLVNASITYTLTANVENLTLTGVAHISATGNDLNNVLTGNSGNNTLKGGNGHDTLNGGTGQDSMEGGSGNDTYFVTAGDTVVEAVNGGTDTVNSGVTHTLAANVENLNLTGAGNINGTGNALSNTIVGTAGNNTLDGAAGADTLRGGAGNDTYVVDNV
eukprot:gene53647-biopygen14787